MSIVSRVEAQHRALRQLIDELDHGHASGAEQVLVSRIHALRAAFLAHLELENRELYPELVRLATAHQERPVADVARFFALNMEPIVKRLETFATRHTRGSDPVAFAADWKLVRGSILRRFVDEEESLHPLHARLLTRDQQRTVRDGAIRSLAS